MAARSAIVRSDLASLKSIGEVAESLDLPQHVLRFWETRFKEISPVKRAGGRRLYRPEDIELVEAIRRLLYSDGYTIKGVQRILKEQGVAAVIAGAKGRDGAEIAAPPPPEPEAPPEAIATAAEPVAVDIPPPAPPSGAVEILPPSTLPMVLPTVNFELLTESERAKALRNALAEIEECKRLLRLTRR